MISTRSNRIRRVRTAVRVSLLTVVAFCCLLAASPSAWALKADGPDQIVLPELRLPGQEGIWLPTLYSPAEQDKKSNSSAPIIGNVKLTLGRARKISLDAFSYGGKSGLPGLSFDPRLGLVATSDAATSEWNIPQIVPRTALAATQSLDDQAQSFKVGYDSGRVKLSMNLQNIGAKFPDAATGLQGISQDDLKALTSAAGTRSFNLDGSLQLSNNANFTSSRRSLYNDKPGDGNRGLTTTDWVNALNLTVGKSTSMKLALTDHSEEWDPSTGKTASRKQTTELGSETKFGTGGKYSLKFGLTDVKTTSGGQEQSDKTQEMHLAMPLHARLQLSADYTRHEDASGNTLTTNLVTGVMKLYPGAELTTRFKTLSPSNGQQTQERYLKLTSGLGHGASTAQLFAEQTATQTPDQGVVKNTKLDLNGGWGAGTTKLNFHGLRQENRGSTESGPLDSLTQLHLDRGFGPRLTLTADFERKMKGTVATYDESQKSVVGLTMQVAKQTKLTAGFSSQDSRDSSGPHVAWNRDLLLEQKVGALQLRAEDHRRLDTGVQSAESAAGIDWAHGKLADWATNLTHQHEFGDIYDYQVAREANWLDLPFAGTRLWAKRRTGGADDGANSLLVSHRMMLAKRYHLQLTYNERPEYDDGDKKGHPQPLRRQYVDVGTKVTKGLAGHAWLQHEQHVEDTLSQRRIVGLGISGKLPSQAQAELYYARSSGNWDGKVVSSNTLAAFYNRQLDDDHKVTVKVGYAWGPSIGNGTDPEYRLTLAFANPV